MSNKVLNNLIFSRMQQAMRKVKRHRKSKRQAKSTCKSKTRRAKRRTMKGGDYGTSVIYSKVDNIPILNKNSKDLSVSIPGFGTVGMEAYQEYMEDRDRRGSAQM